VAGSCEQGNERSVSTDARNFFDWLYYWSVGLVVGRSVGRSGGWLVGRSVGWFIGLLVHSLVGSFVCLVG
jgi:hypothetical protein